MSDDNEVVPAKKLKLDEPENVSAVCEKPTDVQDVEMESTVEAKNQDKLTEFSDGQEKSTELSEGQEKTIESSEDQQKKTTDINNLDSDRKETPVTETKDIENKNLATEAERDSNGKEAKDKSINKQNLTEKENDSDSDCYIVSSSETEKKSPLPSDLEKQVQECDVGITEYISTHEGFSGIIKQRYSDFLVNEVNLNGDIVRLTDTSDKVTYESPPASKPVVDECVLTEEWRKQLQELVEEKDVEKSVLLEVGDDKEKRGKIHVTIKKVFPSLTANTVEKDGVKCIQASWRKGKNGADDRKSIFAPKGEYCRFVLYKENKDTAEAVNVIAKLLRTRAQNITYAGTKDRRAKTCQQISVHRLPPERLHKVNKSLRNMAVGNFRICMEPLKLGDLKGNHFEIVLRNVTGSEEQVKQAMTSLEAIGYINYYGMQRFGTTSVPTHHVGKLLMKSDWQGAIDLILKPRTGEHPDMAAARKIWSETKSAHKALAMMPRRSCIEKHLLIGLTKCHKMDLVGALSWIPRNSRTMYVHAYQSYVWNTLVSRRLKEFGLKPHLGDLVQTTSTAGEHGADRLTTPDVVTEENISNYTIQDVVMPVPGYDVKYPENCVAKWYEEMLAEEGMSSAALKHKVKDYALGGDYRHVVIKPSEVSWQICHYNDVTKALVLSDYEKLKHITLPEEEKDGKFCALKLEFTLPSSSYATMALREVMKCDTSVHNQTSLNVT